MIIAVSGEGLPGKALRSVAKALQVCPRTLKHGRDMAMVLAMSEGFTMNNYLMFGGNQGLAVIPLDGAF